jgi:hypothetical protein
MELLSEDDLNLKDMTPEELDLAWDLWFDLAQATNDFDPPWTHGVFLLCEPPSITPSAHGTLPRQVPGECREGAVEKVPGTCSAQAGGQPPAPRAELQGRLLR